MGSLGEERVRKESEKEPGNRVLMYENIWKSMIVCTNNVFVKVQRDKTTGCGLLKVVKELDNQFCHPD